MTHDCTSLFLLMLHPTTVAVEQLSLQFTIFQHPPDLFRSTDSPRVHVVSVVDPHLDPVIREDQGHHLMLVLPDCAENGDGDIHIDLWFR